MKSRPSRRALFVGTFDPTHTRTIVLRNLFTRLGWDTAELRRDLWGATRFDALERGRLRTALRALRVYLTLALASVRAPRPTVAVFTFPGHVDMLLLAPIWRLRRVPVIFDPLLSLTDTLVDDRGTVRAGSFKARILAWVDRRSFRLATLVLVDTPQVGAHYTERVGLAPDRTAVVWPGTDEARLLSHPDLGVTARSSLPLVFFHGSYIALHGIDTIVRAAHLLRDERIAWELVGDGQERPAIEALLEQLGGIPRFSVVPRLALDEIGVHARNAMVCLGIFGTTEKARRVVPFKVFEYLALGQPVITGDTPAARAALGDAVEYTPPGDPDALAVAIRALIADRGRRAQLAARGRERYRRRFAPDALAADLAAALERCGIAP